jgi:hypothetical protein
MNQYLAWALILVGILILAATIIYCRLGYIESD